MNNKKFGILLTVINVLSIITLERHWKNGVKLVFKKKKIERTTPQSANLPNVNAVALDVKSHKSISPA